MNMLHKLLVVQLVLTVISSQVAIQLSYTDQGPLAREPIDVDGDGQADYMLDLDLWNLDKATGDAILAYDPQTHTVSYTQNLSDITLEDPGMYVAGYPEIWTGHKPWADAVAPDNPLGLPRPLPEMPDFNLTLTYTLYPPRGVPFNLALESWLTRGPGIHEPGPGDVEVMIWLYYSDLTPAGRRIAEIQAVLQVNGTPTTIVFQLWIEDMGWTYLALTPLTPLPNATVSIPYKQLLLQALSKAGTPGTEMLILDDVNIGTEWGSPRASTAKLSWELRLPEIDAATPGSPGTGPGGSMLKAVDATVASLMVLLAVAAIQFFRARASRRRS